jgi:hypothetical protein
LIGFWKDSAGEFYIQFEGDGTLRWSVGPDFIDDRPQQEGEFWLEEGQLFLTDLT